MQLTTGLGILPRKAITQVTDDRRRRDDTRDHGRETQGGKIQSEYG